MPDSLLEKSILATVIYYDCLDSALTSFEIWQRLIRPIEERNTTYDLRHTTYDLYEILCALENSEYLARFLNEKNGFWFLKGREELAAKHIESTKESEEKLEKAFWYRWVFKATPFLLGAFVSGSVAGGRARGESDIDILVIAKKGRIWTVRFFLTLWTTFLGIRRKGGNIANRLCFNHYITETSLKIPFEGLYNAHTYIHLIPLVNRGGEFETFFQKNKWIKTYFFNALLMRKEEEYVYKFPHPRVLEKLVEIERTVEEFFLYSFLGEIFETIARKFQLYFIMKNPLTKKMGGRVTTNEFQLEFHPASKERVILECYNKKLAEYNLTEFYPEKDSGLNA